MQLTRLATLNRWIHPGPVVPTYSPSPPEQRVARRPRFAHFRTRRTQRFRTLCFPVKCGCSSMSERKFQGQPSAPVLSINKPHACRKYKRPDFPISNRKPARKVEHASWRRKLEAQAGTGTTVEIRKRCEKTTQFLRI